MSVDKVFARAQAQRLRFCRYFPSQDAEEYFREICSALQRAKSDIIASMVIDEWLEEQSERPAPADIHKAVARHNGAVEPAPEDRGTPPTAEEIAEYRLWVAELEATLARRRKNL